MGSRGVPWGSMVMAPSLIAFMWCEYSAVMCAHTCPHYRPAPFSHPIPASDPGSALPSLAGSAHRAHPPSWSPQTHRGLLMGGWGLEVSFPHSVGKDLATSEGLMDTPRASECFGLDLPLQPQSGALSVLIQSRWGCGPHGAAQPVRSTGHRPVDQETRLPALSAALRLHGLCKPGAFLGLCFLPKKGGIFIHTRLVLRDVLRSSEN